MRPALVALLLAACGRIGIDPVGDAGPLPDPIDARPLVCPAGTHEIGFPFDGCIEVNERTPISWGQAASVCRSLERRLCSELEWGAACRNAPAGALLGMTDDWEWMAEVLGIEGMKRGGGDCNAQSSDTLTAPYAFRCCGPKS